MRLNPDQTRIIRYLQESIQQGKRFFKSRHIGQEIGLSARTVGANMAVLARDYSGLKIQPWGASIGTTWMVDVNR